MTFLNLIALVFAGGGMTDLLVNGTIFTEIKKKVSLSVFKCPYCLNGEAPFWLLCVFWLPSLWLPSPWNSVVMLPVYGLAAGYAAWLINEVRAVYELDYRRTERAAEAQALYGGHDPVDADSTQAPQMIHIAVYQGERFAFCSEKCQYAFENALSRDSPGQCVFSMSPRGPADNACECCGGAIPINSHEP